MSLNLVKYIKTDGDKPKLWHFRNFPQSGSLAVRFSDNINDISRAPLEEYKDFGSDSKREF